MTAELIRNNSQPLTLALQSIANGCFYGVTSKLFSLCTPAGAFYLGVASTLTEHLIDNLYEHANIHVETMMAKTIKRALLFFGSNALAALAVNAIGFPIKFTTAIVLNIASAGVLIVGSICAVALVSTVILAIRMYRDRSSFDDAASSLINQFEGIRNLIINMNPNAANN